MFYQSLMPAQAPVPEAPGFYARGVHGFEKPLPRRALGGRVSSHEALTGLSDLADQEGFIVAYPQVCIVRAVWQIPAAGDWFP